MTKYIADARSLDSPDVTSGSLGMTVNEIATAAGGGLAMTNRIKIIKIIKIIS